MLIRPDEISITDAASLLGVHRITVWKWCKRGELKAGKRGGHYYPILSAVAEIAAAQKRIAARLKAAQ